MTTYLNYVVFKVRGFCQEFISIWKEDKWAIMFCIWLFGSMGLMISGLIVFAFDLELGRIMLLVSMIILAIPMFTVFGGFIYAFEAIIWLINIPRNIFYWFQERHKNYKEWKIGNEASIQAA